MNSHGAAGPRILTPDQRPRVFVSSTLQELAPERAAARAAIERLGLIPVMFELGARPHAARALYRAYLAQSHVFVALYFESYGWVAPDESVSGLEDEYVLSAGLPRLVYIKSPAPTREPRLADLLDRVRADDDVTYKSFTSPAELEALLAQDLAVLLSESFLLGPRPPSDGVDPGTVGALNRPLPTPVDRLIGREDELATLHDLLREGHRLICIVGPGGIGKTRLALEAARAVAEQDDTWVEFVALANVDDPSDVLPAVATSIGLGPDSGVRALDAVAGAFGTRPGLLVLDNLEHLLPAGSDLAELLARCPRLVILATSRASLHLRGEQLLPLGPLSLPDDVDSLTDSQAVSLFVERATALRPDFTLDDPDTARAVAELCRRLEGIPLAIELAAGRSRLLSPATLLERLGSALDLGEGPADLPARQRTLRDTMAWSEQLLEPHHRELLAALSVFSAPWTLTDAQSVSPSNEDDTFEAVAALVENSLVTSAPGPSEPRFRLFNVVRDYAGERLDELALRTKAEDAFYVHMIGQVPDYLNGLWSSDPARWRAQFRLVWPDLRRAWSLAISRNDHEHAAAAASLGTPLWLEGRNTESVDLLARTVELDAAAGGPTHPMLLINAAQSSLYFGHFAQAKEFLSSLDTSALPADMREFADGVTEMLHGYVASETGDLGTAEVRLREAARKLAACDGSNARWVGAFAHNGLGSLELALGDEEAAGREFLESEELAKATGNVSAEVQALTLLASIALHHESVTEAGELLLATIPLIEQQPFYEGNAYCLEVAARYALVRERADVAAEALGLAKALRDLTGASTWAMLRQQSDATNAAVRAATGDRAFAAAFASGESMDPRASAFMVSRAVSPGDGG